jgi:hypothetical protein
LDYVILKEYDAYAIHKEEGKILIRFPFRDEYGQSTDQIRAFELAKVICNQLNAGKITEGPKPTTPQAKVPAASSS